VPERPSGPTELVRRNLARLESISLRVMLQAEGSSYGRPLILLSSTFKLLGEKTELKCFEESSHTVVL